jgi:hypothetical protein
MIGCDHKFTDSKTCLKCGVHVDKLRAESRAEAARLAAEPAPDPTPHYSTRLDSFAPTELGWRGLLEALVLDASCPFCLKPIEEPKIAPHLGLTWNCPDGCNP